MSARSIAPTLWHRPVESTEGRIDSRARTHLACRTALEPTVIAMSYETVLVENDGPACVITLNRPDKRNAVSVQMMHDITTAARAAEADPAIFAVILSGGDKFFSAGADLNEA